ncbi:hypothetical protein [Tetragenococcus koreensis]|uniref:hypothetical protein n=1 Tax=Tetragenococcus koreensis TaxID=290335 RepID=UPI000F50615A|nr:hypothetical protein [Tetragenococcus koreensis]AYW46765.1 hypothetical protein C7K43_13055 [Tetragenococcus koreensis]GEN89984.1 hypothetical protein TKO01_00300 [Tetragenococcus koreensis]
MSFWVLWPIVFCVIVAIVFIAAWGLLKIYDIAEKFDLDGWAIVESFFWGVAILAFAAIVAQGIAIGKF